MKYAKKQGKTTPQHTSGLRDCFCVNPLVVIIIAFEIMQIKCRERLKLTGKGRHL
jgi:hypothetical protein